METVILPLVPASSLRGDTTSKDWISSAVVLVTAVFLGDCSSKKIPPAVTEISKTASTIARIRNRLFSFGVFIVSSFLERSMFLALLRYFMHIAALTMEV
jgi:hypothetical protein